MALLTLHLDAFDFPFASPKNLTSRTQKVFNAPRTKRTTAQVSKIQKEPHVKKIYLLAALIALSAATIAYSQNESTEKAVAAQEQKWLEAQKANNPDMVAPLISDKAIFTSAEGKVSNKSEELAYYKKMKWDTASYSDVKVTVFGNTAIATGGFKGKGTGPDGKPFDNNERWTDTWVKMPNGKWECVASQVTAIK